MHDPQMNITNSIHAYHNTDDEIMYDETNMDFGHGSSRDNLMNSKDKINRQVRMLKKGRKQNQN